MRNWGITALTVIVLSFTAGWVRAAECEDANNKLGVHRTLTIDTAGGPKYGAYPYHNPLALKDREVVLTFDDGPLPVNTTSVLRTLKQHCTKATFFIVGSMARYYKSTLKSVVAGGHTIGTHSMSHPLNLPQLSVQGRESQIERGFYETARASGVPIAPFFRPPGLAHSRALVGYTSKRNYAVFGADVLGDDWMGISAAEIVNRTMARLNKKRKGILLFHDIKKTMATALPVLLRRLKKEGYKVVHIVPKTSLRLADIPVRRGTSTRVASVRKGASSRLASSGKKSGAGKSYLKTAVRKNVAYKPSRTRRWMVSSGGSAMQWGFNH